MMSARTKARVAGGFYLATILMGVFTQGVVSRFVVSGDASATAANILGHEATFRIGFAVYLVELACQITTTALLYELLNPVSRSGSLLAAIFGLIGGAVGRGRCEFRCRRRAVYGGVAASVSGQ